MAQSFAQQHVNLSRGFRVVPRWFRETPFWRAREGQHRAVIDQLYQMIASKPGVQHGTGIQYDRGQWAISIEALAEASGVSYKVARRAVEHAIENGVVGQRVLTVRVPGRTIHLSLFTWLDFDTYDKAWEATGNPLGESLGSSAGKPLGIPVGEVIHKPNTQAQDTNKKTQAEEEAASPLAGAAAPVFAVAVKSEKPAGSTSEGSDTSSANQIKDQARPAKAKAMAGKEQKPKAQPLTDDEKLLACRSADSMLRYLLWGAAGVRQADDAGLTPTGTNWRHAGRDHSKAEQQVATWNVQHFAAYFWWQVSKYRERKGLPITMPDFGRLGKVMDAHRAKLTAWQLAQKIANVCAHFDLIRFEMQWAAPSLDEATMQHQKIMAKVLDIETSGEIALTARYEKAFDAGYCQTVESERVEAPAAASEPAATSAEVAATDSPVETPVVGAAEASPAQLYPAMKMFQLPPIAPVAERSLSERARDAGLLGFGGEDGDSTEPVDDIDDAWGVEIEPPDYIEGDEEDAEADPVAA